MITQPAWAFWIEIGAAVVTILTGIVTLTSYFGRNGDDIIDALKAAVRWIWNAILVVIGIGVLGLLIWGAVAGIGWIWGQLAATSAFSPNPSDATPDSSTVANYRAVAPGPGCDSGDGVWGDGGTDTYTLQCESNGTRFTFKPNANNSTGDFYWNGSSGSSEQFPTNYEIAVQIAFTSATQNTDAGLEVGGAYTGNVLRTYLYNDGSWTIDRCKLGTNTNDVASCNTTLDSGSVASSGLHHTLALTVHGSTFTFLIDGSQVSSVTDSTMPPTTGVGFLIHAADSETVTFSNFEFTAQ